MVRRYEDPVEVRTAAGDDDRPVGFLWRGRLYVVRDVLGHWRERRAWWTSAAALAVHGEGADPGQARAGAVPVAGAPGAAPVEGPFPGVSTAGEALSGEREVWRVEASRGRVHGTGVFDLCREVPGPVGDAWRLLRVAD